MIPTAATVVAHPGLRTSGPSNPSAMEVSRLFHVQQAIRASCIPLNFEQEPLLNLHSLDASHTPTRELAGRCTCALNMLDLQSVHTYESIYSQFISATPAPRDGAIFTDPVHSGSTNFQFKGCYG